MLPSDARDLAWSAPGNSAIAAMELTSQQFPHAPWLMSAGSMLSKRATSALRNLEMHGEQVCDQNPRN